MASHEAKAARWKSDQEVDEEKKQSMLGSLLNPFSHL